jgi:hypothetical protein
MTILGSGDSEYLRSIERVMTGNDRFEGLALQKAVDEGTFEGNGRAGLDLILRRGTIRHRSLIECELTGSFKSSRRFSPLWLRECELTEAIGGEVGGYS